MQKETEKNQVRRKILSYRFEVERLVADHMRLQGVVEDAAVGVSRAQDAGYELLEKVVNSKSWKFTRPFRRLMAYLRGERHYRDDALLERAKIARFSMRLPHRSTYPVLPEIGELDISGGNITAQKSWATANFLSTFYYDHMEQILSRPECRGKPVFIQMTTIDWFVPLYQRPQHMSLAMAREGYVVFYMTGNGQFDKAFGFHEIEPNVFITNQPVPIMLDNALISFYSTSPVMEGWLEEFGDEMRRRNHVIAYEYIDHIDPEISFEYTTTLARQFLRLDSDVVKLGVASAKALVDELSEKIPDLPIAYVPNGVDVEHYRRSLGGDNRATVPLEMEEILARGKPVVGYFGAIAPWLWFEVINELTEMRKDLSFVFIGPDYLGAFDRLVGRDNVFKLGAIDYTLLPFFAQHFDAAIIPFKPGDIARTTSPLKLFEYFALGLPVVVTDGMDECTVYDVVLRASSAAEYSSSLDEAIRLSASGEVADNCAALAMEHSWAERARTLAAAGRALLDGKVSKAG